MFVLLRWVTWRSPARWWRRGVRSRRWWRRRSTPRRLISWKEQISSWKLSWRELYLRRNKEIVFQRLFLDRELRTYLVRELRTYLGRELRTYLGRELRTYVGRELRTYFGRELRTYFEMKLVKPKKTHKHFFKKSL